MLSTPGCSVERERSGPPDSEGLRVSADEIERISHPAVSRRVVSGPSEHEAFGAPTAIATLGDGSVVVFDAKSASETVLWWISADGRRSKAIARRGSGPAEVQAVMSIAAGLDGSFFVLDPRLARLTHFDTTGSVINAMELREPSGPKGLTAAREGGAYLAVADDRLGGLPKAYRWVLRPDSPDSTFTTRVVLAEPDRSVARQFLPERILQINPLGVEVTGENGSFSLEFVGQHATHRVIYPGLASRRLEAERAELQNRLDLIRRKMADMGVQAEPVVVPEARLAFESIDFVVDGTAWIAITTSALSVEVSESPKDQGAPPLTYRQVRSMLRVSDEGTPLVFVRFDRPFEALSMGTSVGWAISDDADGFPVLTQYGW
ncbi:MAG TPA: hypothetical protein VFN22_13065 [Gemmatimonadales bacterium]|nr:hypothetical protein [Gemmatimonadales bacterium]